MINNVADAVMGHSWGYSKKRFLPLLNKQKLRLPLSFTGMAVTKMILFSYNPASAKYVAAVTGYVQVNSTFYRTITAARSTSEEGGLGAAYLS
ncbi:hypothetical protein [Nitrosospira sp. Is2]|uniref:hypothetical protein n=1 Tax=Nitrosospira sp. Is2 TaxID=3080532 RepID=UPI0029556530|nr:hypothetical protein [Nitrosospira sp. Is2]WON73493.1 hypothetical protein R5L00_13585 [Nitrosospira sp. Is2]